MTSALVIAPTLGLDKLAWAGLAFIGLVGTYGSLIRTFEMENEQISGVLRLDMLSVIRAITCRTTGSLVILVGVLMLLASPQTSIHVEIYRNWHCENGALDVGVVSCQYPPTIPHQCLC